MDQGKEEARTLRVQPGIGTGGSSSAGTTQARFIRLYTGHLSRRSEIQLWPRIKSLVKEAQRWLLRVLYLPRESRFSGSRTWSRSQEHYHGTSMRILLEKLGDGGLEGIQLAGALTGSGGLRRRGEIFGDSSAPDVQMRGDVAQRPVLGPVQAMNFVDLFRCQHGSEFGYTDRPARMP